jgi:hypothetical protein
LAGTTLGPKDALPRKRATCWSDELRPLDQPVCSQPAITTATVLAVPHLQPLQPHHTRKPFPVTQEPIKYGTMAALTVSARPCYPAARQQNKPLVEEIEAHGTAMRRA